MQARSTFLYNLFEVQIFQSASYTAQEIIWGTRYIGVHFEAEKRERWSWRHLRFRLIRQWTFSNATGMYEHMGMICYHAIRVLSSLGRTEIPSSKSQTWL